MTRDKLWVLIPLWIVAATVGAILQMIFIADVTPSPCGCNCRQKEVKP